MIRKIKYWLYTRFLPAYAKDLLLTENDQLRKQIAALNHQLAEKDAYITGLQAGIRSQRRIIINAGEAKQ